MSGQDILGQDEIDALINGARQDAPADPAPAEGEAHSFDLGRTARIVRGTGLLVVDPHLVFAIVDLFFGGKGRHAKIEGREFSAIENNIVRTLLASACDNIRDAWHALEVSGRVGRTRTP